MADTLDLESGNTYPLDSFLVERHTSLSNFHNNTNTITIVCVHTSTPG